MDDAVIELLLKRRSVLAKDLAEPSPDAQQLQTILLAGLRVPDHGRVEPWRIQVLHKAAQRELSALCARLFETENPGAPAALIEAERQRMQRSPLLLVVSSHPDPTRFAKVPAIEQLLSAGALCQNILIAAQGLGFGAQWITGWPAYHAAVKAVLGFGPEIDIVGFIHIGTAVERPVERPRPQPDSIVSEWHGVER
jgi:nitroreductase